MSHKIIFPEGIELIEYLNRVTQFAMNAAR